MADRKNLEQVKALDAYRVMDEGFVEEMDSSVMVLEHKKAAQSFSSCPTKMRIRYFIWFPHTAS